VKGDLRFAVALLLAGQSMMLGLAINLSPPEPETLRLLQTIVLIATLAVVGLLGWPLARSACEEFRRRRVTLEALFVTGMLGATAASLQSFVSGEGPIYFEIVSVLLVVYTLGRRVTAQNRDRTLNAVRAWSQRLATCRLIDLAGELHQVAVSSVRQGDMVAVGPGETVTVDGEIVRGKGFIQDTPVSGEPFARVCRPGDRVLAGSISLDAGFELRALCLGNGRQVDTLLAAVASACQKSAPAQARANQLAQLLFPIVITTALATFAFWTLRAGWHVGLFNALSVLLVACPCALGLATPLALWSAIGRLAERGLVVTRADFVERLAGVDRVVFDKTGTLTENSCGLIGITTASEGAERVRLLSWIAAVQVMSDHPVARAFTKLSREHNPGAVQVLSIRNVAGLGVEAIIETEAGEKHFLRLGRPEWFGRLERSEAEALSRQLPVASGMRVDVELNGQLAAVALVSDRLRDSAADAIKTLKNMNLAVQVMTGDSQGREAAELVPDIQASLLPAEKLRAVEEMTRSGVHPLFVGDGMNDAGALAAAHAGVALDPSDGLAAASAMATLHHGDLRVIPWAIGICRRATTIIHLNLLWAVAYNLLGIILAALGLLHPVAAALIMMISSLGVVWFSSHAGATDPMCECSKWPASPRTSKRVGRVKILSAGHGLAFALQGVFLSLLAGTSLQVATILVSVFCLGGWRLAIAWSRAARIPHWIDMLVGMLTFGNLGMVFGWWADVTFIATSDGSCPCESLVQKLSLSSILPHAGMLTGMLIAGSVAMAYCGRQPVSRDWSCCLAMFGGGNMGMIAGMLGGGRCATLIAGPQGMSLVLPAFVGMTLGMLLGMLGGHILAIAFIQQLSRVINPQVVRRGATQ